MLIIRILLALTAALAVGWRPRTRGATALAACCAVIDLTAGGAPCRSLSLALTETVPLALFLTAAIWLAGFAVVTGLAGRAADVLARLAHGSRRRLYALVCVLCAGLTAAVSLDGAVILMVPILAELTRGQRQLLRPLLLVTVAVANAFSLALPQGNPTNLILMERLRLSPTAFVAHLFVPAVTATVICVGALSVVERTVLSGRALRFQPRRPRRLPGTGLAAAALVAAPLASAAATSLGSAPWWGLCSVAVAAAAAARIGGRPTPALEVPVRVCVQVAALVVVSAALVAALHVPAFASSSLAALLALALAAAAAAATVNNLPATVALASVLGPRALPAYAALTGLSVGALATPHGSVATLIAFERAGPDAPIGTVRHLRLWMPAAVAATAAAAGGVWLIS